MYPNASNVHMKTVVDALSLRHEEMDGEEKSFETQNDGSFIKYSHRLANGPCEIKSG